MKKLIFYVLSFFISFVILYLLVFTYFFFTFEKDFKYNFQSLENLNFYKKYSKKVNHLRGIEPSDTDSLDKKKQLFSKLKRHGLVSSSRGPRGGYRLALGTEEISIAKIIYSVDEKIDITRCHGKQNCQKDQRCLTHDLWMELNMHVSGFLNVITISDLINRNNVRHVSKQQDFAYVQMHRS